MRVRTWLSGCGWALTTSVALANPPASTFAPPTYLPSRPCQSGPALLPVPELPAEPSTPRNDGPPTGPAIEYDRSLLYLPDQAPVTPVRTGPVAPDPAELRVWLAGGVFLGWSSAPTGGPWLASSDGLSTQTILGGHTADAPFRAGFRLDGGVWLNESRTLGLEAGGLYLPQSGESIAAHGSGATEILLAIAPSCGCHPRPATLAGGDRIGLVTAGWNTQFVTADIDVWKELYRNRFIRLAGTAGYRFASLGEDTAVRTVSLGGIEETRLTTDQVAARNRFHGGQIGLSGRVQSDRWAFDLSGEVALGTVFSSAELSGTTANSTVIVPGGLFVRPANAGDHRNAHFAVLPSVSAIVSRQFSDHGKFSLGYTLHYLTDVTRPTGLVGPDADPDGLGLALSRTATRTDFWAQGINVGIEWEY